MTVAFGADVADPVALTLLLLQPQAHAKSPRSTFAERKLGVFQSFGRGARAF